MSQAGIINLAGGGGGGSPVQTLTGNSGGAVPPTANNINTVGTGSITVVGVPGTSTLTAQLTGLTNHSLLVGAGTATITNLGVATNGQLPIGSTGADPVLALPTSTGGTITITAGAGTLNFEVASGGFTWNDATATPVTLAVENGYVTDRGGGVTYTLPATAVLGNEIIIVGKLGAWTIAQNANQQITIGSSSSTVGVGGSIASTNVGDCVTLICITAGASTVWRVNSSIGNITVV